MDNNESKRPEELKEILEGLSSDDSTVVISEEKTSGKIEFRFEDRKKSGLVFEEDEPVNAGLHFESDSTAVTESVPESDATETEQTVEPADEPATESVVEVSFDDSAESENKAAEPVLTESVDETDEAEPVESSTRPWSAYVPRFTEVSDTYRMNDDPRPRPDKVEKSDKTVVAEGIEADCAIDATDESVEEAENVDAVIVNLGQKAEVEEQSFSVYKFSDSESEAEPESKELEPTAEDECGETVTLPYEEEDDFTELLQGTQEIVKETEEKQELLSENIAPVNPKSPKSYKLPDPEQDAAVHVVDYPEDDRENLAAAPDGAYDLTDRSDKKERSEFTAGVQRDNFKDRFLDSIMSAKIRFIATLILTLAMLVFENLRLFGVNPAALIGLGTIPGAMAIADMQFAACIFILALPEVIAAFRRLVRGDFSPEISMVMSLAVLSVYTVVVIGKNAPNNHDYPLFGSLLAAQGLATVLGTCLRRSADFTSFKRISENGEKYVLDKKLTRTLERENLALDGAVDETKSKTVRVFKTAFVSDFFKRTSVTVENKQNAIVTLSVSFGAALVGAVMAFFLGDGWISAVTTFAAIALLTVPAASILVHKLPFYRSVLKCDSEGSTVIGEGSLYDYSGTDVITFNDIDVFGADDVNLKRIIHYGNVDNVMKAMRQMSAIFANVGGPLERIFSNSLDRKCPPATHTVIERDGIFGRVDGHGVCVGTAEYMARHGIVLPPDAEASRLGISDSTRVMYGAEDGVIYVQLHIRYTFSENFARALPNLKNNKVVALVYTEDPNISNELLRSLTGGDDVIRIMKKCMPKAREEKTYKRISAGMVTSGNKLDTVSVVLLAKRYVRLMKTLSVVENVAMALGCVLASLLAIFGVLGITSLAFVGWQALWCVALYIVSLKSFSIKKKEESTNDW